MSQLFVDNIKNRTGGAIGAPSGAVVTGIVTATSFSGDGSALTGIDATALKDSGGSVKVQANTSGIVVTGVSTFSGNVSVGGILTYEDVTNIDSVGLVTARSGVIASGIGISVSEGGVRVTGVVTATSINTTSLEISDKTVGIGSTSTPSDALADGAGIVIYGDTNKTLTYNNTKKALETNIPWATNETRILTGAEKVHRQSGNTVTLTYNSSSSSNVGYTTNPSGDITVNVNGIPTTSDFDDHSITFAVILNNTGTARTCTAVNLNGVPETIRWAGGSLSAALSGVTTTTGHTIFSFTGINTVGSASTAANYQVLGVVSGGFW
jgi:hypothetical protein